jgi:hypothetical protein
MGLDRLVVTSKTHEKMFRSVGTKTFPILAMHQHCLVLSLPAMFRSLRVVNAKHANRSPVSVRAITISISRSLGRGPSGWTLWIPTNLSDDAIFSASGNASGPVPRYPARTTRYDVHGHSVQATKVRSHQSHLCLCCRSVWWCVCVCVHCAEF